jgi:capsule polysaccharide export protein KpsE/RkpR
MITQNASTPVDEVLQLSAANLEIAAGNANWVANLSLLWSRRGTLARAACISFVVSLLIAFIIPKRYESTARIMPPENSAGGAAMFAALAGHGLEGVGGLVASLLGGRNSGALYISLLRSGTIADHLIRRFQLQDVYHKRYRIDAARYLARHTIIEDDKKSGVITLTVVDNNAQRARDIAQAYLDELNLLVNRTSTSSAHQERMFIEHRLSAVQAELERAQEALSDFSSTNATIDIKEQTHAMVDAGAKLQGELIATQGEVDSLRQIYGDSNVRVRAAQARVTDLKRELQKMAGTSARLPSVPISGVNPGSSNDAESDALYPALRQLPRLAVPYADLYRTVKVQETVFELLTQQYEVARIQEAKDVPVVNVIDAPGIPEKKSFPPRALLTAILTLFAVGATGAFLLVNQRWMNVSVMDPRRILANEMYQGWQGMMRRTFRFGREPR